MRWIIPAAAIAATAPSGADAQLFRRPTVSSESGVYAESYSASGGASRRPASTLRGYASPTFEWMGMQVGANLLWSTENRFTAQTMNRFYLNPRWSWGQLHAGDWVPEVSRYTANAVRVRGGGAEISLGRIRALVAGGRSQDANDLSVFDAAPQRTLVAALVGIGDRSRTFFDLSGLRVVDSRTGTDVVSVPPQENLVAGVAGGLALFGSRLLLRGEGSGSLFSRDLRAGAIDSAKMPSWTRSFFTPRLSSRADYAWIGEARLAARRGSLGVQVEYVGPGFTTLGNPYFQSDRRDVRLIGATRLRGGRISASGSLGLRRDNLARDKAGTTNRTTGSLALTAITGGWLVSTATVLMNSMVRDPDLARSPTAPTPGLEDSLRLHNVTMAGTLTEQVRFTGFGVPQQIALSVTSQRIDDRSLRFGALLDATSNGVSLEYGATLGALYTLSVRPAWQQFEGSSGKTNFTSVTGGIARRGPRSPVAASLSSTVTPVGDGTQLRHDGSLSWRLRDRYTLAAQLRMVNLSGGGRSFDERLASLRLTRRW